MIYKPEEHPIWLNPVGAASGDGSAEIKIYYHFR